MIAYPTGHTLRVELSVRLAVQSLLVMALVSVLVFTAISRYVDTGQRARLRGMELLVSRLVETANPLIDIAGLSHLLGAVTAGHDDFRLELADASGQAMPVHSTGEYTPASPFTGTNVRRSSFTLNLAERQSTPIEVHLSLDTSDEQQLLHRLGLTLASAVVIGTALNSVATLWQVRRSLAPVAQLVEQIDRLDAERLPKHLLGTGQPTELWPLVARFNELLDRLDRSYQRMAAFDADVAHELNTPIATLMTSNELALRNDAGFVELRALLGCNLEELERLRTIVRDMLFLSMSECGARARTDAVPSLAALAQAVVELHDAALDAANVGAEVDGDAAAEIDRGLLERALSNLIENATRHAKPGSIVRVDIHELDSGLAPEASLTVSNDGATIPADALPRLFDRFYRLSEGHSRYDGTCDDTTIPRRHGLGLSIVAAIAHMHEGHTVARSVAGVTTLGLVVPVAARVSAPLMSSS